MHSLAEGAAFFTGLGLLLEHRNHEALQESAELIRDEAKRVIGTYDYGWPPLADKTVERKGADTPLLETGEMRDSIECAVHGHVAIVGTDDPKAKFHELGTVHVPPRSFLRGAAMAKEHEVKEICGHKLAHALFRSKA